MSFLHNFCLRSAAAACMVLAFGVSWAQTQSPGGEALAEPRKALSAAEGLPSDKVLSLAQTRDGFLWIGTETGLARYDGRRLKIYDRSTHPTLASEKIAALAPDLSGYLWVGTKGGGLYRFDGINFLPVSRPNQMGGPWDVTALMQQADGLLWVGTSLDLLYLPTNANSLRYGLPGIPVSHLAIDPYDHVWASAGRGLFRQVQLTFQTLSLPLGVDTSQTHALAMTEGGELLIGRDDGLMRARGDFENTGLPQDVELVDGVEGPVKKLLLSQSGSLIIGGVKEIGRLHGDEYSPLLTLTDADDVEASEGRASGAKGMKLYALMEDREHSLWIATSHGLWKSVATGAGSQPMVITSFAYDGIPQRKKSRYVVPPDVGEIRVSIAAPTFIQADGIRLRTRLEGHEEAWRDVDGDLVYTELPAGSYRLLAEVSRDGESWGETRTVELELEPHLHATLSFWLWIFGVLGSIVALIGGWIWFVRRRERLFHEMAAQEWRELQEDSGLIDRIDSSPLDPNE